MSGPGARTFGRFLAERAKAAGVAYGGGGGGGGRGSGGSSGGGGSPLPPGLGRILGGSGAIVALVAGGLAINASLFNGGFLVHSLPPSAQLFVTCKADEFEILHFDAHSRRWSQSYQVLEVIWCEEGWWVCLALYLRPFSLLILTSVSSNDCRNLT